MAPKPNIVKFKTTLTDTPMSREKIFAADAEYILEKILLRTRGNIALNDKLAAYIEQIAIWSPHRQGLLDLNVRNKARKK